LESTTAEERVPPFLKLAESDAAGDQAERAWMKRYRPDAIFCAGYLAETLLAGMSVQVPRDIGMADISMPFAITQTAHGLQRKRCRQVLCNVCIKSWLKPLDARRRTCNSYPSEFNSTWLGAARDPEKSKNRKKP
jgi:hypothetical protein